MSKDMFIKTPTMLEMVGQCLNTFKTLEYSLATN